MLIGFLAFLRRWFNDYNSSFHFYHRQIIIAYKELIRDVHNSLKASTNSEAESFVDNLFGFERRLVSAMKTARQKGSVTRIFRLYDVKTRAHSLPIDTTIQNMFSSYRVDDDTPVKVKDLELIHQISVVATSTEPKILNDFVMWTLVRRFLPLMSHKIRSSLENFQRKLYGNGYNNMPWHFCTQLTHDWMRFGIEALRQNPQLIVVSIEFIYGDARLWMSNEMCKFIGDIFGVWRAVMKR